MVLPKLQEMNDSMIDAARDLGANNLQVIKNIILPFLTPGSLPAISWLSLIHWMILL